MVEKGCSQEKAMLSPSRKDGLNDTREMWMKWPIQES